MGRHRAKGDDRKSRGERLNMQDAEILEVYEAILSVTEDMLVGARKGN